MVQRLQERVDAGQCIEAGVRKRDDAVKAREEFKRTIKNTRDFDRELGQVFASASGTRKTSIGTSTVDWALIRVSEMRRGTNVVRAFLEWSPWLARIRGADADVDLATPTPEHTTRASGLRHREDRRGH